MSGTDPDPRGSKRIDRTQAYRPDDAAPPPPAAENLPKIPGITLQFELARGGMGVVYSGRQDFLDRRVAVKLLSVELGGESFVQRFQREAKILAGIKHPNIVACHMAGQTDDGQSYLVMEFIDGPSLKKWIADNGVVPARSAVRTARAVAQALAHAHTLGIIHRDVKPENILLETVTSTTIDIAFPFTPKLVDLGLARASGGSASLGLTSPGSVMGTPATMSPEQYDEPDAVDFRSDIYGLGCAVYEMLVGQPAFRGKRLSDIVAKKREPIAPDPCRENVSVPAAVGALVQAMLATDRQDRPRSYKELDEQFAALLDAMTAPRATKLSSPGDDDLDATVVRRPGQRDDEPAKGADKTIAKPKTMPPAPTANSGPGLLRTAEINFLAEGLGEAPADPAAASPFQTRPPAGGPAAPPPSAWATNPPPTASPTAASSTPPFGAKSKARLIAAVAIGAVLLGVVAWAFKPPGPKDDGKPGNASPLLAAIKGIKGPDVKDLDDQLTLEVDVNDPEKVLTYEWSWPEDVVSVKGASNHKDLRLALTDGLPGLEVEIKVEVRDGSNSTTRKHVVKVGKCRETQPLAGFENNGDWRVDKNDNRWVPLLRSAGAVSCEAKKELRTLATSLGDEPYWEWFGSLESQDAGGAFANVGMRFEFGDKAWLVACRRSGKDGEQWIAEVLESVRVEAKWDTHAIAGAAPVQWTEAEGTVDEYRAMFSVQRRGAKLVLQVGEVRKPPAENAPEVVTPGPAVTIDLPAGATNGQLTLFVDQGIGRFRVKKR